MPRAQIHPLSLSAILFGVFFGGGALGLGLAELFAPDSHAAQFISFLFLPLALILGFHAWLGLAVLTLVLRLIMRVLRSRAITENAQNGAIIPPGTVAFMPIASMLSLAAGVSVCWLSPDTRCAVVAGAYWGVGTVYGAALWALARRGYLPFPESG